MEIEFNVAGIANVESNEAVKRQKNIDKLGRSYGTGKRKTSIARVWIKPGKGQITVNQKDVKEYFSSMASISTIISPFSLLGLEGQFDIWCTVTGGGYKGQAEAIRHGVSVALDNYNPEEYHVSLRQNDYLTRDDRKVERKKPGFRKARKKTQFSKR